MTSAAASLIFFLLLKLKKLPFSLISRSSACFSSEIPVRFPRSMRELCIMLAMPLKKFTGSMKKNLSIEPMVSVSLETAAVNGSTRFLRTLLIVSSPMMSLRMPLAPPTTSLKRKSLTPTNASLRPIFISSKSLPIDGKRSSVNHFLTGTKTFSLILEPSSLNPSLILPQREFLEAFSSPKSMRLIFGPKVSEMFSQRPLVLFSSPKSQLLMGWETLVSIPSLSDSHMVMPLARSRSFPMSHVRTGRKTLSSIPLLMAWRRVTFLPCLASPPIIHPLRGFSISRSKAPLIEAKRPLLAAAFSLPFQSHFLIGMNTVRFRPSLTELRNVSSLALLSSSVPSIHFLRGVRTFRS